MLYMTYICKKKCQTIFTHLSLFYEYWWCRQLTYHVTIHFQYMAKYVKLTQIHNSLQVRWMKIYHKILTAECPHMAQINSRWLSTNLTSVLHVDWYLEQKHLFCDIIWLTQGNAHIPAMNVDWVFHKCVIWNATKWGFITPKNKSCNWFQI